MDHHEWLTRLRSGERTALSQLITMAESRLPEDQKMMRDILALLPSSVGSPVCRIGITGSPGVGKSSLIDVIGMELISRGHRPAVLTIDPSSAISGGSILGDKARMSSLSRSPEAFIRSSPSASELGGIHRSTRDVMRLLEAASYDRIIIETVGIGQSETDVSEVSDILVYLIQPASGDELQAIKRGIMEYADILAVNKSDGGLEALAATCFAELSLILRTSSGTAARPAPALFMTSSLRPDMVSALVDHIEEKYNALIADNKLHIKRSVQESRYFEHHWLRFVGDHLNALAGFRESLSGLSAEIAGGKLTVEQALQMLVKIIFAGSK